ncbi:MAG TPA: hypothetical protein VKE41_15280 [Roseiflexaceae bacterium]|nr:hypothetical protein [Roseiflexaceae bacterium]
MLIQQQGKFGAYVPPYVVLSIEETRAEIGRVKAILRAWSVEVENLPDDEAPPETASLSKQAGAGLDALIELMRSQEAQAATAVYRASFEDTARQIALVRAYKELHDLLQQIEDRHRILVRCSKSLHADDAWYDLEENEPELYDKAGELLAHTAGPLLAEETSAWTPRLARARQDLRAALETRADQSLRDTLRRLKEIIARQLSRTNTRMASIAGMLRLVRLADALQQISAHAAAADHGQLDDFRHSVTALHDLDERLTEAVRLHSAFQELDDELRRVEGALESSLDELIAAWPDLAPMSRAICTGGSAEWAAQMSALCADVEQALAGDSMRLRRAFGRYRSNTTVCFNRVDYNLRDLCAELQHIGAPLDRVLKVLA